MSSREEKKKNEKYMPFFSAKFRDHFGAWECRVQGRWFVYYFPQRPNSELEEISVEFRNMTHHIYGKILTFWRFIKLLLKVVK